MPDARYDIDTEAALFAKAEKFDVGAVGAAQTPWWNRTLCEVDDTLVRLGVLEGDFHWHKHDGQDEFFLVLEGRLDIELEDRMVSLLPNQAFTVPAGALPFATAQCILMILIST